MYCCLLLLRQTCTTTTVEVDTTFIKVHKDTRELTATAVLLDRLSGTTCVATHKFQFESCFEAYYATNVLSCVISRVFAFELSFGVTVVDVTNINVKPEVAAVASTCA